MFAEILNGFSLLGGELFNNAFTFISDVQACLFFLDIDCTVDIKQSCDA